MTNEELIAQARELCEEQIAVEKYIIRQQKSDDLISRSVRESAQKRLNSWSTHLAEMDEHKNAFVEENYNIFESVEGWYCQGCYERNDSDTPCQKLVTKAKRLLGLA